MTLCRRDLLRAAVLGAAVPVLGACRSGDPDPEPPTTLEDVGQGAAPTLQIGDAESELLVGTARYAFGLKDEDGPVLADDVTVYVGRAPEQRPEQTLPARRLVDEIADRGLYVADVRFTAAGEHFVAVVATLPDRTRLKGGTRVTVKTTSPSPVPGQPMPSIPTPTFARPLGADPLCSRRPVACTMHAISLDAALRNDRPTIVVFAAPAFCRTELCGPDVEIVDRISRTGSQANFLHVEAYRKNGTQLAPVLQSFKFDSEPWAYFVDAAGVVRDRISGAFAAQEVLERLRRLG